MSRVIPKIPATLGYRELSHVDPQIGEGPELPTQTNDILSKYLRYRYKNLLSTLGGQRM